jgi:hypothetical protein
VRLGKRWYYQLEDLPTIAEQFTTDGNPFDTLGKMLG